jgi:hypothetical protein
MHPIASGVPEQGNANGTPKPIGWFGVRYCAKSRWKKVNNSYPKIIFGFFNEQIIYGVPISLDDINYSCIFLLVSSVCELIPHVFKRDY